MFVQARHLTEASGGREAFPIVSFVADWMVHSKIDRSRVGTGTLLALTRALANNWHGAIEDIPKAISSVIGFPALRAELIALFKLYDLPTLLFDHRANWRNVYQFLTWFLRGQPVVLQATGAVQEELASFSRPEEIVVQSLEVVDHEGAIHWLLSVSSSKLPKPTPFLAPAELAEEDDAFVTP